MLAANRLLSAEIGSRLMLIRIHDLCRYARGEVPPKSLKLAISPSPLEYSRHFEKSTLKASWALDSGNESSCVARYAMNVLSLDDEQELGIAISGTLPPIEYREHYRYPTAFQAACEIATDVRSTYEGYEFEEFEWDEKSESERVQDCLDFRQWINDHLTPAFLWTIYQRIEQERVAYLAWRTTQGSVLRYPVPDFASLPYELCVELKLNPHVIMFGEAVFRREVDNWPATQEKEDEQFAVIKEEFGLNQNLASKANGGGDAAKRTKAKQKTFKGKRNSSTLIIAALNEHHQYSNGECEDVGHAGVNKLARHLEISPSTVSAFFKTEFGGHDKYRRACGDIELLEKAMKLLNGDVPPSALLTRIQGDPRASVS